MTGIGPIGPTGPTGPTCAKGTIVPNNSHGIVGLDKTIIVGVYQAIYLVMGCVGWSVVGRQCPIR